SGDFHRLKSATANESRKKSQSNQVFYAFFFFQTGSKIQGRARPPASPCLKARYRLNSLKVTEKANMRPHEKMPNRRRVLADGHRPGAATAERLAPTAGGDLG